MPIDIVETRTDGKPLERFRMTRSMVDVLIAAKDAFEPSVREWLMSIEERRANAARIEAILTTQAEDIGLGAIQDGWYLKIALVVDDPAISPEPVVVSERKEELVLTPEANYHELYMMIANATYLLQRPVRGQAPFEPIDPNSKMSVYLASLMEASRIFKEYAMFFRQDYVKNVDEYLKELAEREKGKDDADVSSL